MKTTRIRAPITWKNKIKARASIQGLTIVEYLKQEENRIDNDLKEFTKNEPKKYPKI